MKQKADAVLRRLGELYPDYVISREMEQEYRDIFRHVTRFSALLGYESWEAFLTASSFARLSIFNIQLAPDKKEGKKRKNCLTLAGPSFIIRKVSLRGSLW